MIYRVSKEEESVSQPAFSLSENFEELTADVYSTVTSVISFTCEGKSYYAFSSKSYGFDIMNVYYILDESGAIVKMTADEFVFDIEYYPQFDEASWNENNYRNNFIGLTDQTFDGSQALIATATLSTNAIKTSTNDIFAAFKVINGGN